MDSRFGVGTPALKFGAGVTRELTVTGVGGVPSNATAVVLNVTVTQPTAATFVTVWPTGSGRPNASSLNVPVSRTRPNLVVATVGTGGRVSLFNNAGSAHVVVDVFGYFSPSGVRHSAMTPARVLDTRSGVGGFSTPFGAGVTRSLGVAGVAGVPGSVSAVVVNVTAVSPTATGYLTLWPSGAARPLASNVNFVAGETSPNLAVVPVGSGGDISVFNSAGSTQVVVDVVGYFDADAAALYHPMSPVRALDSRSGLGGTAWGAGASKNVTINAAVGVPSDATSVVGNLTGTGQTASTFETVWPAGVGRPTASNLNLVVGDTRANAVIAGLGSGDALSVFNRSGTTDLLFDVSGWFR